MNDFHKSVHRKDPAPYEQIRISEIEKDKKGKEEPYQGAPQGMSSSSKTLLFAALTSFFKKLLGPLVSKTGSELLFFDQQQMLEDVVAFRKLLQILSHDDQSHHPEYTQQLSELWHNLLDDCNSILATAPDAPEPLKQLKNFITSLSHYPPGEDHSLGYYFTEYAGKEWIPFPFMNILQALHQEHQSNPEGAILTHWIAHLTNILTLSHYHE